MKKYFITLLFTLAVASTGLAQSGSGIYTVTSSGGVFVISPGLYDASFSSQYSPYHYYTGATIDLSYLKERNRNESLAAINRELEWAREDSLSKANFEAEILERRLKYYDLIRKNIPDFKGEEENE